MKLIELLNKIANDTLEDNTRVIIQEALYFYHKNTKKLYKNNEDVYRKISTYELDIEVEILDNKKETDNKVHIEEIDQKSLKEIISRNFTIVEANCIHKINEIIRVLNNKT